MKGLISHHLNTGERVLAAPQPHPFLIYRAQTSLLCFIHKNQIGLGYANHIGTMARLGIG